MKHTPQLHDCGHGLLLTAKQIASHTGLTRAAVSQRLRKGMQGAALIAPKGLRRAPAKASLRTAVMLARAFPDRVPSLKEIQRVVPMCNSSAIEYRAALSATLEAA